MGNVGVVMVGMFRRTASNAWTVCMCRRSRTPGQQGTIKVNSKRGKLLRRLFGRERRRFAHDEGEIRYRQLSSTNRALSAPERPRWSRNWRGDVNFAHLLHLVRQRGVTPRRPCAAAAVRRTRPPKGHRCPTRRARWCSKARRHRPRAPADAGPVETEGRSPKKESLPATIGEGELRRKLGRPASARGDVTGGRYQTAQAIEQIGPREHPERSEGPVRGVS